MVACYHYAMLNMLILYFQVSTMEQDGPQEKRSEKVEMMTEESFLKDLYLFMKQRDTPIERIPHLGFKQSKWERKVNVWLKEMISEH